MSATSTDVRGKAATAITPSDTTTYSTPIWRIYVGVTGDVKVDTLGGTGITYKAVPAGVYIYPNATKIYATGTTATNLVGEF